MKKLFTSAAFILSLSVFGLSEVCAQHATSNNEAVAVKSENTTSVRKETKMYQQPGQTSEVIKTLNESEEIVLVRKLNSTWSIVKSGDKVGYVQNSKIKNIVR